MNRIVMLNDDLETQMRMYLALCPRYRIDIAENEVALMRLIRRKHPSLLLLDACQTPPTCNGKTMSKLIEKIKHKHGWLHVLAIVNPGDDHLGRALVLHGADGWIDRYLEPDQLLQRVDHMLAPSMPFTFTVASAGSAAEA